MGTGNKKVLCICQICTCGRHHCVHYPKADNRAKGPCSITEYKDTFRKFSNYQPSKTIKPVSATGLSDKPFGGISSYTNEYIPHEIEPRSKREPPKYVKPPGNFDGKSSYQHDYFEKFPNKVISAKPQYCRTTYDRPFSDTTVHKETYKPWDLPKNVGIRPPQAIKLPKSKFNHKSTFQHDFPGYSGLLGRDPIKVPEPALTLPGGSFAKETTTRADYTPKYARPEKSAKPPPTVLRHTDPFDHNTTCQQTYKWPQGLPASSCRPEQMVKQSMQPFDSETTHNATYKPWDLQKRQDWKPKGGWTVPTDLFDHKTTFQHDYIKKNVGPANSARPDYIRLQPGNFDCLTTHNDAYKPWKINPRESYRPNQGYKEPQSKFDGRTTFQTDFTGLAGNRPQLCIPNEGGISFNNGANEFSTMYRDTYLGERPPSCPAKYLEAREDVVSRNGYRFAADRNGHQFFNPPYVQQEGIKRIQSDNTLQKSFEVMAM